MFDENKKNFFVHQPVEEEADAHAFQCVFKYCADNNLDDDKTACVCVGAALIFWVMAFHERLLTLHELGSENAEEYFSYDPILRNMLLSGGHPSPLTRLTMMLHHQQFVDHPAKGFLENQDRAMTKMFNTLWESISPNLGNIEEALKGLPILDINSAEIFNNTMSIGTKDYTPEHFSNILLFLKR